MQTRDVLTAIRDVIEGHTAALGLAGVSYPASPAFGASPWLMIRQSLYVPTRIVKARAGQQVVMAGIDLVVLVASDPTRPQDAARVDGIGEALLDLFDANVYGGNVNAAFAGTGLPDSVDHIWTEALIRRMSIEWGEAGYCHAAIVTLDSEWKRKAALP